MSWKGLVGAQQVVTGKRDKSYHADLQPEHQPESARCCQAPQLVRRACMYVCMYDCIAVPTWTLTPPTIGTD